MKRSILLAMTLAVVGLGIAAADADWCIAQSRQVQAFVSHALQIKIACRPRLA